MLYPLHPTTVAKYREAFKSSGAKSDPLDTSQILEILTKHLDRLKPPQPRHRAKPACWGAWSKTGAKPWTCAPAISRPCGASLKEYFPQALELTNDNLTSRLACDLLKKWPTFEDFQQAKPSTIKRFYYGHNVRSPRGH